MINLKKRRERRIKIVCAISLIFITISCVLIFTFFKNRDNNNEENPLQEIPVTFSYEEGRNLKQELSSLKSEYGDVVAWLKIPGTSIDTPVFQSTDNERYLRNDRDNNQTRWGENFLDYRCNLENITESMQNIIIYGHNTEVDTRFTPLFNYIDLDFYTKHQYIELATTTKNYKFQIFSAYKTTTSFYYIDTGFKDITSYEEFVNSLAIKSDIKTGVSVSKEDTILTLSTCNYEIENGRFVVQAKLVEEITK